MGDEVRSARRLAGLSQSAAGRAAGMSHAQFGRIERGAIRRLSVDQLSRACLVVGLRLAVRGYPDGDPVMDSGQRALLARFRRILPSATPWRTEVPLPIPGDRRAWDAVATLGGIDIAVEAETRLGDIQALERRLALKQRDGGIDIVVLLVADTRTNRRVLAAHREALRPRLPASASEIAAALASGAPPAASGVLTL